MKFTNSLKILLGIIVTIFLGAIGSGVWEKVLSPLLSYLSSSITTTITSVSSSYADSIYARASNLNGGISTEGFSLAFLWFVFFGLFIYALNSMKHNVVIYHLYQAMTASFRGWPGIVCTGSFLVVLLFQITTQEAVEKVQASSIRTMEILRPYIGEEKYIRLKSDFMNMNNKNDFDKFSEKMRTYAKDASVNIQLVF